MLGRSLLKISNLSPVQSMLQKCRQLLLLESSGVKPLPEMWHAGKATGCAVL